MRLLAWNLGHQTRLKRIPDEFVGAVAALEPDVLLLNEYAHDDAVRRPFLEQLGALGLVHVVVSDHERRPPSVPGGAPRQNNQVLAASRLPIRRGDVRGPATADGGGVSNFLHITVAGVDVELIGVRVPAYEDAASRRSYWESFGELLDGLRARRIVLVGDLNADPRSKRDAGGRTLGRLRESGWQLPEPEGAWSHVSGARIDHALATASAPPIAARYITEVNGRVLAGRGREFVSDHSGVIVEFSPHSA